MKNYSIILFFILFNSSFIAAQNEIVDTIYFHNKNIENVVLNRIAGDFIEYHLAGRPHLTEKISKLAIEKIIYQGGKTIEVSKKIAVFDEEDWKRVKILDSKEEALGLSEKGEIVEKTALISFRSTANQKMVVEERLKRNAARKGCPFIFITLDETLVTAQVESNESNTHISKSTKKNSYDHYGHHGRRKQEEDIDVNSDSQTVNTENTQTFKKAIVYCY